MKGNRKILKFFISSSFIDLEEERRDLSLWVFPNLNLHFNKLGYDIVNVDLRWGALETSDQNKLVRCLEVIDSCRPYFIGIIGHRYGSIPERNQFPIKLNDSLNWLEPYAGNVSMTEIEIIYGALKNQNCINNSIFFFKDLQYTLETTEDPLFETYKDRFNDKLLAHKENQNMLIDLKRRIRASGANVYETHLDTSSFLKIVEKKLFQFITKRIQQLSNEKDTHNKIESCAFKEKNIHKSKRDFINTWLARYERNLDSDLLEKLILSKVIETTKEVEIVLEEMRHFADFEDYNEHLEGFLEVVSFTEIYDKVIERTENSCGKGITRDILSIIALSNRLYTEEDLSRYTGINRGAIGGMLLAIGKGITGIDSYIKIIDNDLRIAIYRRYLNSVKEIKLLLEWTSNWE